MAGAIGDTKLVRISYDMDFDQTSCSTVGIAYPVYCFGLPNIVMHFIRNVKLSPDAYIFGLASYGGMLSNSGNILRKELGVRGYRLAAGFALHMPGNAQSVYDVPAEKKRLRMYEIEQKRLESIGAAIKSRKQMKVETNLGLPGKVLSLLSPGMMSKINESAKSFFTDANCDGCGICSRVCLVNNVTLTNGKPQRGVKCECCLACFHWCPQKAIQTNKKTAQRGRYHHPEVALKDVTVQR